MKNKKLLKIFGEGDWLQYANSAAIEYGQWDATELVLLKKINDYSYDLSELIAPEEQVDYFLAIDGSAFGTVREKHLSDLISRGFRFISIIPPHISSLMKSVNCLISCNVSMHSKDFRIQFNTFLGPFSSISSGFFAGRSVTIGAYTEIGSAVRIGKNVSISGVKSVASNASIGEYSRVDTLETIETFIKPFTSYSKLFPRAVYIKNE